ncbi:ComF family protein [Treponema phagedenis]|nr:phosphoribosyltransferase family protein [Treponema phagedenis]NVP23117.1 ComF family protein [Treponema phagedenis]QEJ95246.1 ComF family protein [Treponema phagedenis]QEJ98078.1 ComF family protein [Treponema phagedenis]QEK01100.1 ComF family protein [Treponema phagedenis]QEK03583.1 ComF family protein [Treponema phagedenis]
MKRFAFILTDVLAAFYANLLCPQQCAVCGEDTFRAIPLCKKCAERLLSTQLQYPLVHPELFCACCGRELISEQEYCTACHSAIFAAETFVSPIQKTFALFPYIGLGQKLLPLWKNKEIRSFAPLFSKLIGEFIQTAQRLCMLPADIAIVPVPPRPKKLRKKGWDQIEDLARRLEASGFSINRCLTRKDGTAQKQLSRKERQTNLSGKIAVGGKKRIPEKLLIIDDVMTTGATLNTCAEVLKNSGCKEIYALCLFYD